MRVSICFLATLRKSYLERYQSTANKASVVIMDIIVNIQPRAIMKDALALQIDYS